MTFGTGQQHLPDSRPFSAWTLNPCYDDPPIIFEEPPSRRLLWKYLSLPANDASHGRQLFSGNVAQRNRLWRAFSSFVRQAETYDATAAAIPGNSAALPLYYAMLQLSKAELLLTNPDDVVDQPIHHGLRMRRSGSDSITGDQLQVVNGVFPELYSKRTGSAWPVGRKLRVTRLVAQIPEIGWEVDKSGLGQCQTSSVVQALVGDATHLWILWLIRGAEPLLANRVSSRLLRSQFTEVKLPGHWREVFGFSARASGVGYRAFEARWQRDRVQAHPAQIYLHEFDELTRDGWHRMRALLDATTASEVDGFLCPSVLGSEEVTLPASLARYALLFYASSLVRYHPAQVDRVFHPNQAWIFDALVAESHVPLLINALNGITRSVHVFLERGAFRL